MNLDPYKITVVTATLNAEKFLPRLIASLRAQTDKDFEWLVADGCSTDGSASIVQAAGEDLRIRFLASRDFGIYDALNRAVQSIDGGYYLVLGADDTLVPDAIGNFRAAVHRARGPDFVTAPIRQAGGIIPVREGLGWLYGLPGLVSSHAVGLLIRQDLHRRFGWYSRKFPIAADQLFVKQALAKGSSIARESFVAGEFSTEGTSGSDPIGLLTDVFRVQLLTERYQLPQFLLFSLRLWKCYFMNLFRSTGRRG